MTALWSHLWSHYHNADHISRVLEHYTTYPVKWQVISDMPQAKNLYHRQVNARGVSMDSYPAQHAKHWADSWDLAAKLADMYVDRNINVVVDRYHALDAIVALMVHEHSASYLDMDPEELRVWAALSEDPAAVLLLPAVIAMNTK